MSFIKVMVRVSGLEIRTKNHPEYHPLAGEIYTWDGATENADTYAQAALDWLGALRGMADYQIDRLEKDVKYCRLDSYEAHSQIKHIKSFLNFAEHADKEAFRVAMIEEYERLEKSLYA